ncbi:MAG: rhodanese-like domain-containing protein [Candidatus Marinimicrobia bacterium]|nr:rhodanese-like domain-containing protein [Candidatus Neomarinimicrobiota bacterium]
MFTIDDLKKTSQILAVSLLLTFVYFIFPGSIPLVPENIPVSTSEQVNNLPDKQSNIQTLTYENFIKLYESSDILLVDARPNKDFLMGHIPGAMNIPYKYALDYIDSLESMENRPAILISYCDGNDCGSSYELARQIYFLFDKTYSYHGGWEEWQANKK